MARLINADNLVAGIEKLKKSGCFSSNTERILLNTILTVITMSKTIDPVKHGHWIEGCPTDTTDYFNCSVCNAGIFVNNLWRVSYEDVSEIHRFCLNCGAKMDGKEE